MRQPRHEPSRRDEPLFNAVSRGDARAVREALANGASPLSTGWFSLYDNDRVTPLFYAAEHGLDSCVAILAPVSDCLFVEPGRDRDTPLSIAAMNSAHECVAILAPLSDAKRQNSSGRDALLNAVLAGCLDSIRLLIPHSDIDSNDKQGLTPCMLAAMNGQTEILSELLLAGANPDLADRFGMNPLMLASLWGQRACVEILLPVTDLSAKDISWRSAQDIARSSGYSSIASEIEAFAFRCDEAADISMAIGDGGNRLGPRRI